jgi:hypothetical protein
MRIAHADDSRTGKFAYIRVQAATQAGISGIILACEHAGLLDAHGQPGECHADHAIARIAWGKAPRPCDRSGLHPNSVGLARNLRSMYGWLEP